MAPRKHSNSKQSTVDRRLSGTIYFGDRLLFKRVKDYVDAETKNGLIDVETMADDLQQLYREYGRKKKTAFKKTVEKAYSCLSPKLDDFEVKHLSKKMKKDEDLDDDDSDSFSSDNPDYVPVQDTNLGNSSLRNLYMKKTPTSTPKSRSAASTPVATPLATPLATPMQSDSEDDRESVEMSNVCLDLRGVGDEEEECDGGRDARNKQFPRQPKLLMPRVDSKRDLAKDSNVSENSSANARTPMKDSKAVRRKSSARDDEAKGASIKKKPRTSESEGSRRGKKKVAEPQRSTSTFADIGGNDRTLEEVCKMLVHMKHPEVYQQLGVPPPRGVLLHGPPGCGKTLLANAIAGELDLPYLKIAATEIVSGVSGESEENIRDLFEQAQALAPSVLFIDEIDAITPKRETAQREMERRIVAQLLACMDELNSGDAHVMVIGATNRVDSLDPALRRAGRFDKEISLGIPDASARTRILQVLCRNLRLDEDFSYPILAGLTPGYVGADLTALCREAAMCAVNRIFTHLQVTSQRLHPQGTSQIIEGSSTNLQASSQNSLPIISEQPLETRIANDADSSASIANQNSDCFDTSMSVATKVSNHVNSSASIGTGGNGMEAMDTSTSQSRTTGRQNHQQMSESESYQQVLSWLKEHPPLNESQLEGLRITMDDFREAVPKVQPSAKREGFATIPDVTWDDVGALEGVREELTMAIVAPVRNPDAYQALGLTNPPGILLAGPPGCGKTLLAKAIANESGINFISVKGPELMNMYVGESERAVRQCFQRARNSAPCVIFFDELDALCPRRSDVTDSGSSARVVNQLLTEMDGLEARKQVFIMGATNRPDIIDPAVLRPGRMDKILYVGIPTAQDRVAILTTITKNGTKPPLESEVNLANLANDKRTDGFTGADLAAFVREASMSALRKVIKAGAFHVRGDPSDKRDSSNIMVCGEDFEAAFRKVKPSVSRKDRVMYDRMRTSVLRDVLPSNPEAGENSDGKTTGPR